MTKYKTQIIIAIFIIVTLLVINHCNNKQHQLQGERKQLKEQLKKEQDGLKIIQENNRILFDSLSRENKKKDVRITQISKENSSLESSLQIARKNNKEQKEKIFKYTYTQSAEYVNNYFKVNTAIPTEKSVNLESNLPNLVVSELEDKKLLETAVEIKDSQLKNKDEQIKLTEEKVLNKNLEIASKDLEKEQLEKTLNISLDLNKKSEKQIKQLKAKSVLNKVLIVGAFLGGGYLGTKIK
jgi:hypothetical protein